MSSPRSIRRSELSVDKGAYSTILVTIVALITNRMEHFETGRPPSREAVEEASSEQDPSLEVERVFREYQTVPGKEGCAYDAVVSGKTSDPQYGELAVRYLLKYDAPPTEGPHPAVGLAEALGWEPERIRQLEEESKDYLAQYLAEGRRRQEEYDKEKRAGWQHLISEASIAGYRIDVESARRAESEGGFELAFALYANLEPESIRELGFIGMTEMYPSLLSDYLRERGDAPLEMLDLIKKELAEGVEYHIAAKSYSMLSHGNHTGVEAAVSVAAVDALELILEIRGSAWRLGMSNILMDPIVIKSILNSGIALGEFIQPSALQRCRSNPVDRMYTDKEITQVPGIFNRHYLMNRKREAWGNPLSFADIRARTEHTGRSQE